MNKYDKLEEIVGKDKVKYNEKCLNIQLWE